ncbi:MAG TPA: M48 family metallopeptidase [Kiritimatiellia bacterium]|nr:M48 family metallopeptidase [Kiritimatiellia bacterium]
MSATESSGLIAAPLSVQLVPNRRARRYIARVLPGDVLRITIPRTGTRDGAMAFAGRIVEWAERQRARHAALIPPPEWPAWTSGEWARAHHVLTTRLHELAAMHGLEVRRVTIRRQRSRWGSCSRRGTISLNARLAHTPDYVRDYVILHELMHLREMNHSQRFWAHVDAVCPRRAEAEAWLRRHAVHLTREGNS